MSAQTMGDPVFVSENNTTAHQPDTLPDIAGLHYRFDFSNEDSITKTSGNLISRINNLASDDFANARTLTGSSGNPLWVQNGINNLGAAEFGDANDYSNILQIYGTNHVETDVYLAMQPLVLDISFDRPMTFIRNVTNPLSFLQIANVLIDDVQKYVPRIRTSDPSVGNSYLTDNFTMTLDRYVMNYRLAGTVTDSKRIGVNGTYRTLTIVNGHIFPLTGGFSLGGSFFDNVQTNFRGRIGEILIYNRILTIAERDSVNTFLKTKWGVA